MSVGKDIVFSLVWASVSPSLRLMTLTGGRGGWCVPRKSIAEDFLGRRVKIPVAFFILSARKFNYFTVLKNIVFCKSSFELFLL